MCGFATRLAWRGSEMNGRDKYGQKPHGAMGVARLKDGRRVVVRGSVRVRNRYGYYNQCHFTVIDDSGSRIGSDSMPAGKFSKQAKWERAWAFADATVSPGYLIREWEEDCNA